MCSEVHCILLLLSPDYINCGLHCIVRCSAVQNTIKWRDNSAIDTYYEAMQYKVQWLADLVHINYAVKAGGLGTDNCIV